MFGKIRSAKSPKTVPAATRTARTRIFLPLSILFRISTASPTPAPEKSPASISPEEIMPDAARLVRATDAAQFGIRPKIAARRWDKTGSFGKAAKSVSSPMKNMAEFMMRVMKSTNPAVFRVWKIADAKTPFEQWP